MDDHFLRTVKNIHVEHMSNHARRISFLKDFLLLSNNGNSINNNPLKNCFNLIIKVPIRFFCPIQCLERLLNTKTVL